MMAPIVRVPFDALTFSDEQFYMLGASPFTGVAFETFADGAKSSETTFHDGIEQGISRFWSSSGVLLEESEKWCGACHGLTKGWTEEGRLLTEQWFEFGIKVAERRPPNPLIWRLPASDPQHRLLVLSRSKFGPDAPLVTIEPAENGLRG